VPGIVYHFSGPNVCAAGAPAAGTEAPRECWPAAPFVNDRPSSLSCSQWLYAVRAPGFHCAYGFRLDLAFSQICIFVFSYDRPGCLDSFTLYLLVAVVARDGSICTRISAYISSISVCVIRSCFSLIFPNMETNLACRCLHLLDRFVLSHVSSRAWRIMSVRHCSFIMVLPRSSSSPLSTNGVALSSSLGRTPAPIGHLQVHRSIDPSFLVEGRPITIRPWEDRHFVIVG